MLTFPAYWSGPVSSVRDAPGRQDATLGTSWQNSQTRSIGIGTSKSLLISMQAPREVGGRVLLECNTAPRCAEVVRLSLVLQGPARLVGGTVIPHTGSMA